MVSMAGLVVVDSSHQDLVVEFPFENVNKVARFVVNTPGHDA